MPHYPAFNFFRPNSLVNEDWLLNGNKPIFIQPNKFSIDDFMEERGATELETEIIKTYFELEPTVRKDLFTHFTKCFKSKPVDIESSESSQPFATISTIDLVARLEALEQKNAALERENKASPVP